MIFQASGHSEVLHFWRTFEKPFPMSLSFSWRLALAIFQMILIIVGGWMRLVILKFLLLKKSPIDMLLSCDQLNGLLLGVVMLAQGKFIEFDLFLSALRSFAQCKFA